MPLAKIDANRLRNLIEDEKHTQAKAAELLGCSLSCVERTCKRLGLQTQRTGPRDGPLHPDWKGGRILVGGYWYLWTNTHPRRTKANYIAEHRQVAESTLGRYLERHEVVHHRNGDPQDNRPENLEVFEENSAHLRHELSGRVPNWTPDGLRRMADGVAKMVANRRRKRIGHQQEGRDDAPHTQTTSRPKTIAGRTVPQAS